MDNDVTESGVVAIKSLRAVVFIVAVGFGIRRGEGGRDGEIAERTQFIRYAGRRSVTETHPSRSATEGRQVTPRGALPDEPGAYRSSAWRLISIRCGRGNGIRCWRLW